MFDLQLEARKQDQQEIENSIMTGADAGAVQTDSAVTKPAGQEQAATEQLSAGDSTGTRAQTTDGTPATEKHHRGRPKKSSTAVPAKRTSTSQNRQDRVSVNITMSEDDRLFIKMYALTHGTSVSALFREFIEERRQEN